MNGWKTNRRKVGGKNTMGKNQTLTQVTDWQRTDLRRFRPSGRWDQVYFCQTCKASVSEASGSSGVIRRRIGRRDPLNSIRSSSKSPCCCRQHPWSSMGLKIERLVLADFRIASLHWCRKFVLIAESLLIVAFLDEAGSLHSITKRSQNSTNFFSAKKILFLYFEVFCVGNKKNEFS